MFLITTSKPVSKEDVIPLETGWTSFSDRLQHTSTKYVRYFVPEKTQIHHIRQGVDYLGFHFYLTETGKVIRKLRQSRKKRFKKKLSAYKRLYKKGEIEFSAIGRSLISYKGHLSHGHTYHLRKNIWDGFVLTKNGS